MGAIFDKVIGPYVIGMLRPQADARPGIEPEAFALRLLLWNFQPLPPPDTLHALEVDDPTRRS